MTGESMGFACKYFSTTGSGAFFGAGAGVGAGANMLAQLFFTPSGIILDVAFAATAEVAVAVAPHPS